jgi:uncharacterized protein YrrD
MFCGDARGLVTTHFLELQGDFRYSLSVQRGGKMETQHCAQVSRMCQSRHVCRLLSTIDQTSLGKKMVMGEVAHKNWNMTKSAACHKKVMCILFNIF